SCSVTMMLFLHLEVKPLMTLTTVLYLSCALISGHLAMMLMEQIGRASCRERVWISVGAVRLKKKKRHRRPGARTCEYGDGRQSVSAKRPGTRRARRSEEGNGMMM